MNVNELPEEVWIGEIRCFGDRIERVVHLTEEDALEDIVTLAPSHPLVEWSVGRERLHTGQVDSMEGL